jgi:lipopolysaccharide transport system ATP-binding protein
MTPCGITSFNVWKKFRRGELFNSLRDLVPAAAKKLLGRAPRRADLADGDFWAVRDVSFAVEPGEALGIIGPNGAGKSTMLKLLTRILRPTRGEIQVRGRVGALIEVAAGFHPDLTGRENIYLQGAVMGMKRAEIRGRFDRIVEFSGISEFIDTPVKRYSTGMSARLGFSVAAHLEPDVLIIDEVLAVGDYTFQAKAFDRIHDLVVESGIPVVVVSHQLDRVATLCNKAVFLNHGEAVCQGTPADCISAYVLNDWQHDDRVEDDSPVKLQGASLVSPHLVPSGGPVRIQVSGLISDPKGSEHCTIAVRVRALHTGQLLFVADANDSGIRLPTHGRFSVDVALDLNVRPGLYRVEIIVRDHRSNRLSSGPAFNVQVKGGPSFWGRVQMNPRMHLVLDASPARVVDQPA